MGRVKHNVPAKSAIHKILPAPVLLVTTVATAGSLTLNSGVKQVALLELYTSQGCGSYLPAERWLNEYIDDEDLWTMVVPVAFHVDYWDYIGWKDIYATAENGERQRDYARGWQSPYCLYARIFINGYEWCGWTLRLNPRSSDREPGNLVVEIADGKLQATFSAGTVSLELHFACWALVWRP